MGVWVSDWKSPPANNKKLKTFSSNTVFEFHSVHLCASFHRLSLHEFDTVNFFRLDFLSMHIRGR